MKRSVVLAVALSFWVLLTGCRVLFGYGQTISHMASFAEDSQVQLREETGFEEPAVGFVYEYFSLFFLNVWTGGGGVVLYDADETFRRSYLALSDERLVELTGRTRADFGAPWLYRVPLGWIVLALVILGVVAWTFLEGREIRIPLSGPGDED